MLASLDPNLCNRDYKALFVQGRITDSDLDRRIARLSDMFKVYVSSCPAPFWAEGLLVTDETARVTETYLNGSEIRRALKRLLDISLRAELSLPPLLLNECGWLGFLEKLPASLQTPDPGSFLSQLAENEAYRLQFLFSVYLPDHYGGTFGRYPGQLEFIRNWVKKEYTGCNRGFSCLDAACGSGEGSYELAGILLDGGLISSNIRISGVTINPLEVFAAAHSFFPHNQKLEENYRKYVKTISKYSKLPDIRFMTGDLSCWNAPERYNIIICNGILGGPFLSNIDEVENVLHRLAGCLEGNGVLLAADRFHDGWKKKVSTCEIEQVFRRCRLDVLPIKEGLAGVLRQNQN